MNDEDAFQKWLDRHPDDHTCRLVFADWLEERDDPRAEGYRALGRLRLHSLYHACQAGLEPTNPWGCWELWSDSACDDGTMSHSLFPDDWLAMVRGGFHYLPHHEDDAPLSVDFLTRSEADDAIARAFAGLPAERRAELLNREAVPA
jgi:uncharacterized protein (TIGR02996 family)